MTSGLPSVGITHRRSLHSFRGFGTRAYRLKASNAAPSNSTSTGTFPLRISGGLQKKGFFSPHPSQPYSLRVGGSDAGLSEVPVSTASRRPCCCPGRSNRPKSSARSAQPGVAQNIGPLSLDLDLKAKPLRDRCVAFPVTPMFQHELSGAGFPSAEYECNVATGADGVRRIARFGR
jgi:hypothetical protein